MIMATFGSEIWVSLDKKYPNEMPATFLIGSLQSLPRDGARSATGEVYVLKQFREERDLFNSLHNTHTT
jgi:hypothetical protein